MASNGADFGGIMRVRLSGGTILSMRGTFTLSPGMLSAEHITNQDGSVDRTFTPTSPRAEITVADKNVKPEDLIGAPRQPVSIVEEHTGKQHIFDNAFFTGDPQVNRINGEVSGLTIVGEGYRKIGNG